MSKYKYPPMKASGVMPDGSPPPELLPDKERIDLMTRACIKAAVSIGGKPRDSVHNDKKAL